MRWILIKTKYKQKMQIILQYKKLWGKLEIINIIKANVGKYTRKGKKCEGVNNFLASYSGGIQVSINLITCRKF